MLIGYFTRILFFNQNTQKKIIGQRICNLCLSSPQIWRKVCGLDVARQQINEVWHITWTSGDSQLAYHFNMLCVQYQRYSIPHVWRGARKTFKPLHGLSVVSEEILDINSNRFLTLALIGTIEMCIPERFMYTKIYLMDWRTDGWMDGWVDEWINK